MKELSFGSASTTWCIFAANHNAIDSVVFFLGVVAVTVGNSLVVAILLG